PSPDAAVTAGPLSVAPGAVVAAGPTSALAAWSTPGGAGTGSACTASGSEPSHAHPPPAHPHDRWRASVEPDPRCREAATAPLPARRWSRRTWPAPNDGAPGRKAGRMPDSRGRRVPSARHTPARTPKVLPPDRGRATDQPILALGTALSGRCHRQRRDAAPSVT